MGSFSMANLCIKTPSSASEVLIFQLLVLRPRPNEQCMAEFQTVPDIRKVTNLWENHEKWTMFHFQAEHLEDKTETEGGSRGRMHHLLVSRTILRKKCISYFEKLSDFESLYRFPEAISLLASWCIQSNGLQMNYWSYDVTFLHSNSVDHCTAFQI